MNNVLNRNYKGNLGHQNVELAFIQGIEVDIPLYFSEAAAVV